MSRKYKAVTGLEKQKERDQVTMDATTRHLNGPVQICSQTGDVEYLPFIGSNTSTFSKGDLLSISLAIFLANLETTSRTAAGIDLHKIIQDPDFDAHLSNIKVKDIECFHDISDRIVKLYKQ